MTPALTSLPRKIQPSPSGGASTEQLPADSITIPFHSAVHPVQPKRLALKGKKSKAALPTNAWWENLLLDLDSPVITSPYAIKSLPDGLQICYPMRTAYVTDFSVTGGFTADVAISLEDGYSESPQVSDFDDLSVEVTYGPADDDSKAQMVVPLVRGSPLITMELKSAKPILKWTVPIKALEIPEGPSNSEGSVTYQVQLSNGQNWLVYSRPALQFEWTNTTFMRMNPASKDRYTGTIRVGMLTCGFPSVSWQKNFMPCQESAFQTILPFLHRYPVSGSVDYRIIPGPGDATDKAELMYQWKTRGVKDYGFLMSYLPHHMMMMDSNKVTSLRKPPTTINTWQSMMHHWSSRGPMTPVVSTLENLNETWTLSIDLPALGFYGQVNSPPQITQDVITSALKSDVQKPLGSINDTYHLGKKLAMLSKLALIAKQLHQTKEMNIAVDKVEKLMISWLNGTDSANRLVYDQTWGGLIVERGLKFPIYDFGNGYYNDHHFHYGYMIYSLAVWMYLRPESAKEALDGHLATYAIALVKDIANSEKGVIEFPVARHFDFYECHSWASGLFKMPDGREQESSSEAVNAYYAVSLLGSVLGDTQMRDYGRMLCALETLASRSYWHIPGVVLETYFPLFSTGLYPPLFTKNAIVGVVGGDMASHTTWFGTNVEYVHGIQMLPFTPASEYLLPKDFVTHEYGQMGMALGRKKPVLKPTWAGYIRMAESIIDPKGAWMGIKTLNGSEFDDGNSLTAALYWIATRPLDDTQTAEDVFSSSSSK
eukprot:jgi/Bigna1/89412/estExt_fgenesh1_pg.C_490008